MDNKRDALGNGPLTDEQLDGLSRWNEEDLPLYAKVCGTRAAAEIRSRRAADMTDGERLLVAAMIRDVRASCIGHVDQSLSFCDVHGRALAVLDRLLKEDGNG